MPKAGGEVSANQLALWYLAASVLFILALKGLSRPCRRERGNLFGVIAMAIAVLVTLAITRRSRSSSRHGDRRHGRGVRRAARANDADAESWSRRCIRWWAWRRVLIAVAVVNNPGAFGEPTRCRAATAS